MSLFSSVQRVVITQITVMTITWKLGEDQDGIRRDKLIIRKIQKVMAHRKVSDMGRS